MSHPYQRPRRLRNTAAIRALVQEHQLSASDFILPVFVVEGEDKVEEISSMLGYFRYSIDKLLSHLEEAYTYGIRSVLLFVKVEDELKDNKGTEAYNPEGLMQRSIRVIKKSLPDMYLMTDVALDPYSSFGHDGIVENQEIVNDKSVDVLAKMGLSHAQAGADMLAPSDMMDGRIARLREVLEQHQFPNVGIMSYAVKYASAFYGPFRNALDSAPGFGDKATYQMNPANALSAYQETKLDVEEGADILMVKPGMPYLDMVFRVKEWTKKPVAVYQVSGEYAMIKAAVANEWLEEDAAVWESLIAFKRAGADLIASYFSFDIAKKLYTKKL